MLYHSCFIKNVPVRCSAALPSKNYLNTMTFPTLCSPRVSHIPTSRTTPSQRFTHAFPTTVHFHTSSSRTSSSPPLPGSLQWMSAGNLSSGRTATCSVFPKRATSSAPRCPTLSNSPPSLLLAPSKLGWAASLHSTFAVILIALHFSTDLEITCCHTTTLLAPERLPTPTTSASISHAATAVPWNFLIRTPSPSPSLHASTASSSFQSLPQQQSTR